MNIDKQYLIKNAPKERYDQQLKDPRWKLLADNIRKRDNYQCCSCGAKNTQLDVHHIFYFSGHEAWEYEGIYLITLCHKCHEGVHDMQEFLELKTGDYFYHKFMEGVGVVDNKDSGCLDYRACWTETDQNEGEDHGRLFFNDRAYSEDIRAAKPHEIEEFWKKVIKYYSINTIIECFGEHLKTLLPYNHPIRIQARECYVNALNIYKEQKKFVKEHFDYFLLVSDSNFAAFQDNRKHDSPCTWPADELPRAFFLVAPKQDVIDKPQNDNSKEVPFDNFDFSGYRAANNEETSQWVEYTDHLFELNKDKLPF